MTDVDSLVRKGQFNRCYRIVLWLQCVPCTRTHSVGCLQSHAVTWTYVTMFLSTVMREEKEERASVWLALSLGGAPTSNMQQSAVVV